MFIKVWSLRDFLHVITDWMVCAIFVYTPKYNQPITVKKEGYKVLYSTVYRIQLTLL